MQSTDRAGSASWAGRGRDSTDSRSGVHFSQQHASDPHLVRPRPSDAQIRHDSQQEVRRRRSSIAPIADRLRNAGGPNSFDNFARSWQRAAGFYEVTPRRQSFRLAEPADAVDGTDDVEQSYERMAGEINTSPATQRSLLREQLEREEGIAPHQTAQAIVEEDEEPQHLSRVISPGQGANESSPLIGHRLSRHTSDNIFSIEPQLASPFGGSYGSAWGSYASRVNEPSMRHAGRLFRQQQQQGAGGPDKEREPLLVKQIQDNDGKIINVVVGQSTVPQTVLNSINVLVGVGLLALPLAIRYAGWVPGLIFLIFAALTTSYTARLLAKCADTDPNILTFAHLGRAAFGWRMEAITSVLFSLELIGASVALIVLFADSLDALIPGYGLLLWKIACGVVLVPLAFVPLHLLSILSGVGIVCTFGITGLVLVSGLIKQDAPGSLHQIASTSLFPVNWFTLPISFGLLMSPWGGHSVFPSIYRDMRHPKRYPTAVSITYISTFFVDVFMAVIGYLMFGDGVFDEVTRNIVSMDDGYPSWITWVIVLAIAIIPITKVPLNAKPIIDTCEATLGLVPLAIAAEEPIVGMSSLSRGALRATVKVLTTALFVLLAVAIPEFDRIMSLIGAVACFTICIILPCAFHLKLYWSEIPRWQKALDWTLIVISTILALVSTAFNFIPKEKLGIIVTTGSESGVQSLAGSFKYGN